jgi:hypothetical protein
MAMPVCFFPGAETVLFKLGSQQNGAFSRHRYGNFVQEGLAGATPRICIAASGDQIELLSTMAQNLSGPFALLAVLHTPRVNGSGRYQSPPLDCSAVQRFLSRFRDFLQNDARLDLWVKSMEDDALLVYDRHDLIYAYGPLASFKERLLRRGFIPGEVKVPLPHEHHYHDAYDDDEKHLLGWCEWRVTPLRPEDEQ